MDSTTREIVVKSIVDADNLPCAPKGEQDIPYGVPVDTGKGLFPKL